MLLSLEGTTYTPETLFRQVFSLLDLNQKKLPSLTDDPQHARIDPLINALRGK